MPLSAFDWLCHQVGAKSLTPAFVAALKWDEPKIRTCPKIGAHPLQLRDADVLLLRDGATVVDPAVAAFSAGAKGVAPRGVRKGGKLPTHTVVGGGAHGGARRETGLSIHTVYDDMPPGDGGPAGVGGPAGGGAPS